MKKCKLILPVLAVTLVLASGIKETMAYFTTYATAKGGYTIELGDESRHTEEFSNWTKHVVITNSEESSDVYVRVKAFTGSEYSLHYSDDSGKWNPGEEGFYYYSEALPKGADTERLDILISDIPEEVRESDSFNVIVVYESTPVLYDGEGNPYADWKNKVTTKTVRGENDL